MGQRGESRARCWPSAAHRESSRLVDYKGKAFALPSPFCRSHIINDWNGRKEGRKRSIIAISIEVASSPPFFPDAVSMRALYS